ncbi:homologous-pairing protein 2 homolog isoform X2 [Vespa crabro]|uniref:homologous-pairing protein 2 homolog isoform X2 n=1 Tax=Vespa crabro TaxID=7445 RepID=UPI001F010285|nr:homologous-pairing protein 2 homolog isoform X2 [Vespa crabro]
MAARLVSTFDVLQFSLTNYYFSSCVCAIYNIVLRFFTRAAYNSYVYGKQKVYCVVQDSTQDIEELMRIDKELQAHANDVETRYQDLEKEIKNQETLLKSLKSSVTVEEAYKEKVLLVESIKVLTNKLDKLIESTGSMDLTETKRKTQSSLDEYTREYVKRKRLCTDIIDCILENYPGTKSELYDEIGIDPKIIN